MQAAGIVCDAYLVASPSVEGRQASLFGLAADFSSHGRIGRAAQHRCVLGSELRGVIAMVARAGARKVLALPLGSAAESAAFSGREEPCSAHVNAEDLTLECAT